MEVQRVCYFNELSYSLTDKFYIAVTLPKLLLKRHINTETLGNFHIKLKVTIFHWNYFYKIP